MKAAQKDPHAPKPAQPHPTGIKNTAEDFLSRVDNFLHQRRKFFLGLALIVTTVFSLMLFDGRMSFATDDSTYLQNAVAFYENGTYPTFQGVLYPFVLGLIIQIAGFKLILLKFCSLIFMVLQVWVYYKAFYGRVPGFILFTGLFVIPFNAYILGYASSTFSESFFMLIQALCFLVFFRLIDRLAQPDATLRNTLKHWLLFGFCFFLISITKNATILAVGVVFVYFLLRREWKYAFVAVAAFLLFKVPYQLTAQAIFGDISSKQTEQMMQRVPNDPSQGKADAGEFVDRFFTNYGQYITLHTFKMLGLRESGIPSLYTMDKGKEYNERYEKVSRELYENSQQPTNQELMDAEEESRHSWGYTLIFLFLTGLALYHSYLKNQYIFFSILYVGGICAVTFVALHTFWNQDRLMVIFLPFFFSAFLYGLYAAAKTKRWKALQPVVVILGVVCLIIQLGTTMNTASKKMRTSGKHLGGDLYAGLVPVHANYAKMAAYIGKNIPDSGRVLVSKPEEAFSYSGGKMIFTRMPSKTDNADSLDAFFKKTGTRYILASVPVGQQSIGANPTLYKTVSVLQTYLQKYPARLREMHTEGTVEQAVLYRIEE